MVDPSAYAQAYGEATSGGGGGDAGGDGGDGGGGDGGGGTTADFTRAVGQARAEQDRQAADDGDGEGEEQGSTTADYTRARGQAQADQEQQTADDVDGADADGTTSDYTRAYGEALDEQDQQAAEGDGEQEVGSEDFPGYETRADELRDVAAEAAPESDFGVEETGTEDGQRYYYYEDEGGRYTLSERDYAREVERDFLEQNPEFDAGDVAIQRGEGGGFYPVLTGSGTRLQQSRQRQAAAEALSERTGYDIDPSAIVATGATGFALTDEAVAGIQQQREESRQELLSDPGTGLAMQAFGRAEQARQEVMERIRQIDGFTRPPVSGPREGRASPRSRALAGLDATLEEEFGTELDAGVDYTVEETTNEQGETVLQAELTEEGQIEVAGVAETGETFLDENIINPVLDRFKAGTGVGDVFSPGRGDIVQQIQAGLRRDAEIHRAGRGALPSGEQLQAGIGEGYQQAPLAFMPQELSEGFAYRAGETLNPAALALAGGQLIEGTGELVYETSLSGIPTEEELAGVDVDVPGTDQTFTEVGESARAERAATQAAIGMGLSALATGTVESAREQPARTVGSAFFEAAALGGGAAASPLRYSRARIPVAAADDAAAGTTAATYRGLTLQSPAVTRRLFDPEPRPLVGVTTRGGRFDVSVVERGSAAVTRTDEGVRLASTYPYRIRPSADVQLPSSARPSLGTPDVGDVRGPAMAPNTGGYAPTGRLESRIVRRGLRRQLEGEDLARFEAAQQMSRLGRGTRLEELLSRGRRRGITAEEGIREAELIPDEAAPEVAEFLRESGDTLGGSASQLAQARRARTPQDIDIYTSNPARTAEGLRDILGEYTDRPIRRDRGGLEIQTQEGWEHLVDINPAGRATGRKAWGRRLQAPTQAGDDILVQPLEAQLSAKLEGAVRLFGEETIAPKTWRAKDVLDVADVGESLAQRKARSLNPLDRLRARRARGAVEEWREAFGDLDLPDSDFQSTRTWAELEAQFETTELGPEPGQGLPGLSAGDGPNWSRVLGGRGTRDRGQVDLAGLFIGRSRSRTLVDEATAPRAAGIGEPDAGRQPYYSSPNADVGGPIPYGTGPAYSPSADVGGYGAGTPSRYGPGPRGQGVGRSSLYGGRDDGAADDFVGYYGGDVVGGQAAAPGYVASRESPSYAEMDARRDTPIPSGYGPTEYEPTGDVEYSVPSTGGGPGGGGTPTYNTRIPGYGTPGPDRNIPWTPTTTVSEGGGRLPWDIPEGEVEEGDVRSAFVGGKRRYGFDFLNPLTGEVLETDLGNVEAEFSDEPVTRIGGRGPVF